MRYTPLLTGRSWSGAANENGGFLVPGYGALYADTIIPVLRNRLEGRLGHRLIPERPERTVIPVSLSRSPFFCSGCPHNRSTEVPDGSLVGAGIGCHTMAILMDPDRVGEIAAITAMGNEGTQWIGMSPFVDTNHMIQNLGDGTFFHSGQLAIQASIAAGVNITYKLLYNGTVAMTGGQHPTGQLEIPQVVANLANQGVARMIITTDDESRYRGVSLPAGTEVWSRDRIIEAQEVLAKIGGVTIMIHDQACAAENRRGRKRGQIVTPGERIVINQRICEGCGDCGQVSNCLSVQPIETPFGRKTHIDQTTCNFDYSCLEGDCPSFMTVSDKAPGLVSRWFSKGMPKSKKAKTNQAKSKKSKLGTEPVLPPLDAPTLIVPSDTFNMRITGVGGTGVVTVAQIIGTAAMLDGFEVRGLDQIGLSQKAGPVVSDVRMSRLGASFTNRLGESQADLLLAFDQLVAASDAGLQTCDPSRTVAVGSTSSTPTGEMITHLSIELPALEDMESRISSVTKSSQHWADAHTITAQLFGDTTTANLFVVGMAIQAGALPVKPELMEQAIALNGVAIEANTQAFRWGRAQVSAPELVEKLFSESTAGASRSDSSPDMQAANLDSSLEGRIAALGTLDPTVRSSLSLFASELVAWQDTSTANDWFDVLDRVHAAEAALGSDDGHLLEAVAANLFKLTAYKDEYEVARLMLDAAANAEARELAGSDKTIAWKLHPPMLRALGMDSKVTIGPWATPMIRALAKGKKLRGSTLDPFGYPEVRKVERELPGEYKDAMYRALAVLSEENYKQVIELAELPDIVRGYEDIKMANVKLYRDELARISAELGI